MKRVYHATSEEYGEIEGMFSEDGDLIDLWSSNDAQWRNEYFSSFMRHLGIIVIDTEDEFRDKLEAEAKKMWG